MAMCRYFWYTYSCTTHYHPIPNFGDQSLEVRQEGNTWRQAMKYPNYADSDVSPKEDGNKKISQYLN